MFKIYVGNLDYKVKVEQLRELFAVYAPIEDLVIPLDEKTNKAKGFGIVMIRDPELGRAAVKAMQGKRLMGRTLVVNEAAKKKKSGVPEPLSKAELVRNGPFGPRMFRGGDPRGRVTRNPRRSGVTGASAAPAAPSSSAPPTATPAPSGVPRSAPKDARPPQPPVPNSGAPVARPPLASPARAAAIKPPASASPPAPPSAAAVPSPQPSPPARPKATKRVIASRPAADANESSPSKPSPDSRG